MFHIRQSFFLFQNVATDYERTQNLRKCMRARTCCVPRGIDNPRNTSLKTAAHAVQSFKACPLSLVQLVPELLRFLMNFIHELGVLCWGQPLPFRMTLDSKAIDASKRLALAVYYLTVNDLVANSLGVEPYALAARVGNPRALGL